MSPAPARPRWRRPDAPPSAWRFGFWGLIAAQTASLAFAIESGDGGALWRQASFLGLMAVLLALGQRLRGWILVAPAAVAVLAMVGRAAGWYAAFAPLDEILHLTSGAAVPLPLALIAHERGLPGTRRPLSLALSTLGLAVLLGVAWEVAEGTLWPTVAISADTASDLLLDALGGALAGGLAAVLVRDGD